MKKFFENLMAAIGLIAVAWMIYTIVHFGSVNMRRAEQEANQYRVYCADRR